MITVSSAFQAAHDLLSRTPVYRVTFSRSGRKYSTHPICDYKSEVLADAPSLYLRLGEASGITAADSSGNGLDGQYQNAPTLGATGAISGCSNKAVTFNGTDEYVAVVDNDLLDPGDTFTLECWVNATNFTGGPLLIDKGTNGYSLQLNTGGQIIFGKSGVANIVTSTALLSTGTWHHVVATKTGSTVKLYLDGVDVTGTVSNQTIAATATSLNVGRGTAGSNYFTGSIDEVALYPTALSAARVAAHYNAGKLGQYLTTWLDYLRLPTSVSSSHVDPLTARVSTGSMMFSIDDVDGSATDLVTLGLGKDTCTFEVGYLEIQGEEFEPFMTGVVESVRLNSDLEACDIAIRDPQSLTNREVFQTAATRLTAVLARDATDTYVHYVTILGVNYVITNNHDSTAFDAILDTVYGSTNWSFYDTTTATLGTTITVESTAFFLSSGYVIVDKEIIRYTGKTATTFTGLTRGALDTASVAHEISAPARELLRLGPAHLLDIATEIITRDDKRGLGLDTDYASAVMADSPSLYLRFNEGTGTTARDETANALNGVYQNTPTLGADGGLAADTNSSVTLNGTNEYVSVADNAALDPGDTFSLEMLIYITALPGLSARYTLFSKGTGGYLVQLGNAIDTVDGGVVLAKQGTADIVISTIAVTAGAWNHVLVTKATTTVKIYINGVDRTGTVTNQTIAATATDLNIGRHTAPSDYFAGSIDEAALYSTALSAARALAHYQAARTTATHIDIAAWKAVKTSVGPSYHAEFRIAGRRNAKEFLESEIYRIINCYAISTGAGLLSIHEFAEPTASASVETLDDDSILVDPSGRPAIGWDANVGSLINHVAYDYDYDPVETNEELKYKSTREDEDEISIGINGQFSFPVKSQGLRTDQTGTTTLIDARIAILLRRYSNGAPLVSARAHLQTCLIETGDVISLSSSLLPNRFAHTRGVTSSLFEVLSRTIHFDKGYVDFDLLWTGFGADGSDTFNRADVTAAADENLGAPIDAEFFWIAMAGYLSSTELFAIVSNQLRVGAFGSGAGAHGWMNRSGTQESNQFSELEWRSSSGSPASGPAVRLFGTAYSNVDGYAAIYTPNTTTVTLRKYDGTDLSASSGTSLGSASATLVAGDVLRIQIEGSTLRVYLNGALIIGPVTDATPVGGAPGVLSNSAADQQTWDNWRGGDGAGWA